MVGEHAHGLRPMLMLRSGVHGKERARRLRRSVRGQRRHGRVASTRRTNEGVVWADLLIKPGPLGE